MKRIAYISPVFNEKNTYRENVLVEYLKAEKSVEIFAYHDNVKDKEIALACDGIKIKIYFYLSTIFTDQL